MTAAAREREVGLLVVGLPVRPEDGTDSPFAARVRNFARRLAEAFRPAGRAPRRGADLALGGGGAPRGRLLPGSPPGGPGRGGGRRDPPRLALLAARRERGVSRSLRRWIGRLAALAAAGVLAFAAGLLLVRSPFKGYTGDSAVVEIPFGTSTRAILETLERERIVRSRHLAVRRAAGRLPRAEPEGGRIPLRRAEDDRGGPPDPGRGEGRHLPGDDSRGADGRRDLRPRRRGRAGDEGRARRPLRAARALRRGAGRGAEPRGIPRSRHVPLHPVAGSARDRLDPRERFPALASRSLRGARPRARADAPRGGHPRLPRREGDRRRGRSARSSPPSTTTA